MTLRHAALITVFLLACPVFAQAAYNASDVIGQTDGSDHPVFTTNAPDDGGSIGPVGINSSDGAVMVDTVGHRLFVDDTGNNRVLVFNLDANNNLIDHTADYVLGAPDFTTVGDQSDTHRGFDSDLDESILDPEHELLYLNDEQGRVMVFDIRDAGSPDRTLCGVTTNGIANNMEASCEIGQPNFDTFDDGVSQTQISIGGEGIGVDTEHSRLYLSDWNNNRILVFDVRDTDHSDLNLCGTVTHGLSGNGIPAACVIGQPDFTTKTYSLSQKSFSNTEGSIAYDPTTERLYAPDQTPNRLLVYDVRDPGSSPQSLCGTTTTGLENHMDASCVLGQPDFDTASNQGVTQNAFGDNYIYSAAIDSLTQRLYVSNVGRVLVFDVSSLSNNMNATAVIGQDDFISSDMGTTQSLFNGMYGQIDFDPTNNRLYVADVYNNRFMIFDFVHITTSSLPSGMTGTAYSQTLLTTASQGTVSFSIVSGALPTGLSLDSSTGSISGTPSAAGSYSFSVKATDDNGGIGNFISPPTDYTITIAQGESSSSHHSHSSSVLSPSQLAQIFAPQTPPAPALLACLPGDLFNTATGKPCVMPTYPATTSPSAGTTPLFTLYLTLGSRNEQVLLLQKYLNSHNFVLASSGVGSPGHETNYFGAHTKAAVIRYQKAHGIPGTGNVGPLTRGVLNMGK